MMAHRSLQHQVADGGVTRPAQPEPAPQNMLLDVFCVTAGLFNTLKWSSTVVVFFAPDIWCSVVNWNNVEFGALRRGTNSNCFQRGSGVLRAPCSCQHGPSGLVKIVRVRACVLARVCVRLLLSTLSLSLPFASVFKEFVTFCQDIETSGQQSFWPT